MRTFAVTAYLAFLASFLYFAAFVVGLTTPRPAGTAPLLVDGALVAFFGVVHSLMARGGFKRWWTTVIPPAAERSVYVLVASAQLALLTWQWRPVPGPTLWTTSGTPATLLTGLALVGFGIAFAATFHIDHLELFGLRQGFARAPGPPVLRTPGLYRLVRHPLYFGVLVAVWAAPQMSLGRLALAVGLTVYIAAGARLEERDLARVFGEDYRAYQRKVRMLFPFPRV